MNRKNKQKYIKPTKFLICVFLITGLISCVQVNSKTKKNETGKIRITWIEDLSGDFTFKENWDYPEGIYRNDFGQLSCDGICPPEIERMKDENGRIFKDSLDAFYNLVDTTHQYYSIHSEAQCYEWAGTNFVTARKINNDTTVCFTHNNAATHSCLNLIITKEHCTPTLELNSVANPGNIIIYACKSGQIEIDKELWNKGVIKAIFNFTFDEKENTDKLLYWKGKIYAEIETK